MVSHQDVSSNRFLPGCYVDVKSFIVGDDILSKMMLDRYSVDVVSGERSLSVSPVDLLGVLDG